MEIQPASLAQIQRNSKGQMVEIDADVGGVVIAIKRINENFHVRWSDLGEYFVVYYEHPVTHVQDVVTTCLELDHRLTKRMERIASRFYNAAEEADRIDKEANAEIDRQFSDKIGDYGERLAHALRKDLGLHRDTARSKRSWAKGLVGR